MEDAETARGALAARSGSLLLIRLRSIGDAILMTPLAAAVRRERPQWCVTAVLEPPAAELLTGHPHIDRVLRVERGLSARVRGLRALRRARADLAIDLHGGSTAALFTRFSGATVRVGLEGYRSRASYDLRLASPHKGQGRTLTLHTVAANLAIAAALGLKPDPDLRPHLTLDEATRDAAALALRRAGVRDHESFIAIHPGATLASKTWPRERFLEIARRLAHDLKVVWLEPPGAPGAAVATPGVIELHNLELRVVAGVIARSRLLIANDSGPSHIAAALDIATVTIFGSQDPRVWRPLGRRARVLSSPLPCAPCAGVGCANPHALECLDRIRVADVVATALESLGDVADG